MSKRQRTQAQQPAPITDDAEKGKKARRGRGRPKVWIGEKKKEAQAEIIQRLIDGEDLTQICRYEGMPCRFTVWQWLNEQPDGEFASSYARARASGQDAYVEEGRKLARQTYNRARRGKATREEVAALRELLAHTHWTAARLAPKQYSEQVQTQLNISGTIEIKANLEQALLRASEHRRKLADQRGNVVDVEPDDVTVGDAEDSS